MAVGKTWILVADASRARVLAQSGHEERLKAIGGFDLDHPIPKTSDVARDSLPRTFDSVGEGRHAISPKTDPRRAEKNSFAIELANRLHAEATKLSFDHLIIIAPPQMMGDLRAALSNAVRSRLSREMTLDLTHESDTEIARRIGIADVA